LTFKKSNLVKQYFFLRHFFSRDILRRSSETLRSAVSFHGAQQGATTHNSRATTHKHWTAGGGGRLLKLIHRLHHPGDSAWAQWARTGLDLANLTGRDAVGAHWDALRNLLPFYRCITSVVLGDGRATSFWDDHWHGSGTLASTFPSLASHVAESGASVSDTKRQGVRAQLVPRLSRQAAAELTQVEDILDRLQLSNEPDDRLCPLIR